MTAPLYICPRSPVVGGDCKLVGMCSHREPHELNHIGTNCAGRCQSVWCACMPYASPVADKSCETCAHGPRMNQDQLGTWNETQMTAHPCQFCARNQPYADNWKPKGAAHAE